jgi:hypothetical protein
VYLHFTHGSATTYAMPESSHNRRLLASVLVWNLVCACNRAEPPPSPPPEGYAADIAKLCDVMTRSGADRLAPDEQVFTTARWLAGNLATQEARTYLANLQRLDGAAKADALDAEARKVGLAGCALAAAWRVPRP